MCLVCFTPVVFKVTRRCKKHVEQLPVIKKMVNRLNQQCDSGEFYSLMGYWLVVLTILKNMKVNGKDYPIYYGK